MKICYWPNGIWCEASEIGQMTHLSDDFSRIEVDDDLDEEGIEQLVKEEVEMKKYDQEVPAFVDEDEEDPEFSLPELDWDDDEEDPEFSLPDAQVDDGEERVNILYTLPPIMEQIAFVRKHLPLASVTECRDIYAIYHSYKEEGQSHIVALQYAGLT